MISMRSCTLASSPLPKRKSHSRLSCPFCCFHILTWVFSPYPTAMKRADQTHDVCLIKHASRGRRNPMRGESGDSCACKSNIECSICKGSCCSQRANRGRQDARLRSGAKRFGIAEPGQELAAGRSLLRLKLPVARWRRCWASSALASGRSAARRWPRSPPRVMMQRPSQKMRTSSPLMIRASNPS